MMLALQAAAARPLAIAAGGAKPQRPRPASAFFGSASVVPIARASPRAAASLRLRVAAVAEFASTVRVVVQGRGLTITPAIKEVSGGSGGGAQEGGRG